MSKIPELPASVGSHTTVAPVRKETTASGTKQAVTGGSGRASCKLSQYRLGPKNPAAGRQPVLRKASRPPAAAINRSSTGLSEPGSGSCTRKSCHVIAGPVGEASGPISATPCCCPVTPMPWMSDGPRSACATSPARHSTASSYKRARSSSARPGPGDEPARLATVRWAAWLPLSGSSITALNEVVPMSSPMIIADSLQLLLEDIPRLYPRSPNESILTSQRQYA